MGAFEYQWGLSMFKTFFDYDEAKKFAREVKGVVKWDLDENFKNFWIVEWY